MDGIDGIEFSVLWRGTPGFEGYPGVVGSPAAKPASVS